MTTRSVRAYVTGIMRKFNLKEEECTKFMTGGPDGDLGSNEILMSKEKIIASKFKFTPFLKKLKNINLQYIYIFSY